MPHPGNGAGVEQIGVVLKAQLALAWYPPKQCQVELGNPTVYHQRQR